MALNLYEDDLAGIEGTSTRSAIVNQPASGIGMAPAPRNPRQEEIAKMGGLDKFMAAVGEGSAAFLGRPSPLNQKIESQRKEKQLELEELRGYTSALEEGVKLTEGLEGPERDKFVKSYKDRLDKLDPGLGDTFDAATKRPELLTKFREILPHLPKPMQDMATANPKGFLKFVGTAAGVEMMSKADDQRLLGTATRKAKITLMGLQQLIKPEKLAAFNKDGVITASEFREMQEELPEPLRLAPTEMEAIGRNDEMFWTGLGVLSGKGEQDLLKERGKKADKAPESRKVRRGDKEITQEFRGGKWVDVEKGEAFKPSENVLPDEVKAKVAAIQLKVLGGEDPSPEERKFLDEVARTNPLVAAMRDALGNAQVPNPAPSREAAGRIKPPAKPKKGETISRGGKKYKVVGFDKDGEPLVELAR